MKKSYLFGLVVSLGWWALLVYDQLNLDLVCTPDDSLCNSGNTVSGDIIWGTMMAFVSLTIAWGTILTVYFVSKKLKRNIATK